MVCGFLIDPAARTLTPVDVDKPRDLIGCDRITTAYFNDASDVVYVDDEGLLKGPTDFFLIEGYPQPLAGKGVVVGTDAEGNDISPTVSEGWLRDNLDFGHMLQIGDALMFMGDRHRRIIT